MKTRKLLSILYAPVVIMLLTIQCAKEDGITYSLTDVSSRITGFSNPKTGAGAQLTFNGTQLGNVQRIFFNNERVLAKDFVSQTESAITINVPATVSVGVNELLFVFTGSERAFNEIEVIPLQAASSFTPYSAAAGETITLVGVNFNLVTAIKLGDVAATIISQSPTLLTFTMPSGAPNGKITLVGSAGNTFSSAALISCEASPTSTYCVTPINLNSAFELGSGDNFDNWNKANGGSTMFATSVPGEFFNGSRGFKVVRDGTLNSGQWRLQLQTDPITTVVGADYTVYFWVRATVAVAGGALRGSLSPDTGYYSADLPVTTAWQQLSFVVPGAKITTTATKFSLDMNASNTVATTLFVDDVRVVKN